MRCGAGQLGIRRTELFIEAGGIVDSIIVLDMEGGCTCLSKIWSSEESSENLFAAILRTLARYLFRGNAVLNLSRSLANARTSVRHRSPCLASAGHPTSLWNSSCEESSGWLTWHPDMTCLLWSLTLCNSRLPPLMVDMGHLMMVWWVGAGLRRGVHFASYYEILDLHLLWTGGRQ